MVAYEKVFETVFDWETKRLFTNWSLMGSGHLQEVARRELTVFFSVVVSLLLGYYMYVVRV